VDYFGPFSARTFRTYKPSINKATQSQLTAIPGIGDATATRIIDERKRNGDFKNREDAIKQLKLDRSYSNFLIFPDDK